MNKDIYFAQQSLLVHLFFKHDFFVDAVARHDFILVQVDRNFALNVNE